MVYDVSVARDKERERERDGYTVEHAHGAYMQRMCNMYNVYGYRLHADVYAMNKAYAICSM